jgi:Glycosyl hydrolase catalytic core
VGSAEPAAPHTSSEAQLEVSSRVVVPSSNGAGAQFNQHVYAAISSVPQGRFAELERKVMRLEPQFVRIFYNDAQERAARDQLESFILAAELAERAGATINVTWQSGGVAQPDQSMGRFADVLAYLARSRGLASLQWATVQNEPNSTKITPAQNAAMYRSLDRHLANAGVRDQIRFMGGDLVQTNQRVWFRYMASRLADLLDAYSVHIYWEYWDTVKFSRRLAEVQSIVAGLPTSGRKPVFVTEYGVRGRRGAKVPAPGTYADGTPLAQTRISAFQHAWFQIVATQLGYVGTVKWDCYAGKYDRGTQAHYVIGPWRNRWPLYPTYHVMRLVTETTAPGWKVVAVEQRRPSARTKHLTAFTGPEHELTILGLDAAGSTLNGVSPIQVTYTIGGLPSRAEFTFVVWNRSGDGQNEVVGTIAADETGIATIAVPLHAVFALTTKPVSFP